MTYWATLWYAGSVVITIGFEGQTLNNCDMIGEVMMFDIVTAYADPERESLLADSVFPIDEFSFTCEPTRLPIDEKYTQ